MHKLYSLLITLIQALIPVAGFFNAKLKKSIVGRKHTLKILKKELIAGKPTIWIHAASLGEYEQGVPVLEELKKKYPEHQMVISFFSPSGYEIKKNNAFAKATVYLPFDTPKNVTKFLDIVSPEMAFFVKYEFWPNYLSELQRRKIRTFLISGVFRESQPFFKPYGKWMTASLKSFEHFFLQNEDSATALQKLGFENFSVSGDTRYDRVSHQIEMNNTLDFVHTFKNDKMCVVCGSTWAEDDDVIINYINKNEGAAKFIIAPHEIKPEKIALLASSIKSRVMLYSQMNAASLASYDVLIIDTIGLLTKIYSYADIAYVGGAMGTTGLHNILEPATFGVPIITGGNFDKFPEAKKLQQLAGLYAVTNQAEFDERLSKLIVDETFRAQTGMIAGHFINSNTGATKAIIDYLNN
ncbi:glycosyltransferase N-terminal domain-containing protein [Dokdonia sp. PRO95]|uniref:3-deoxy-D-manno-octulosonic acid transferase n=1 Tax=Dokdonia sp. PRO95 TaxID=1239415 RepID=UPI0005514FE5|nr:glycosyltransferase N-terminal domain-containing protein [Dokdonia sp. PRO95]